MLTQSTQAIDWIKSLADGTVITVQQIVDTFLISNKEATCLLFRCMEARIIKSVFRKSVDSPWISHHMAIFSLVTGEKNVEVAFVRT